MKYSKEVFEEMINDWMADHAEETEGLVIGELELDENGNWVARAEDEKTVYSLADDGTGNIICHYDGTK